MTEALQQPATHTDPAGRRQQILQRLRQNDIALVTELLTAELATGEAGLAWATDVIIGLMQADDLTPAGDFARIVALARYGGRLPGSRSLAPDGAVLSPSPSLSAGKLRHDAAQLAALQAAGRAGDRASGSLDRVRQRYQELIEHLDARGPETREPLADDDQALLGEVYGRVCVLPETARVERALSSAWDPRTVEHHYLTRRPGVVVIDDFLSAEALAGLQAFCRDATVWNANRYPNGRLGAFFDAGFNCPLVLQVAEEVRASFPVIIGDRHRLRQLWGFTYPSRLPADSTVHADFAAVNLNFWITPESANADPATGGLVIYDVDAPRGWDFVTYNERLDLIKDYIGRRRADVHYVPYRENRAILFNSDLFHATAEVNFHPGHENRRINITMLYGIREEDDLHPGAAAPQSPMTRPWRSPALARRRRG